MAFSSPLGERWAHSTGQMCPLWLLSLEVVPRRAGVLAARLETRTQEFTSPAGVRLCGNVWVREKELAFGRQGLGPGEGEEAAGSSDPVRTSTPGTHALPPFCGLRLSLSHAK